MSKKTEKNTAEQEVHSEDEALKKAETTAKEDAKSKKEKKRSPKEEVEELTIQLAEAKDKYLRLFAEFDNFKKRNVKERMDLIRSAGQDVIGSLLPVLDDFDRAKKHAEDESSEETISDGILLVYDKLYRILGSKGLEKMESTGEPFDPELHEALTKIPAPTEEMKGKVLDTIESGFKLKDKIIRHAKVVVAE